MAYSKEQRIINSMSGSTKTQRSEKKETSLTGSFNIPNKSGDHMRSIKRDDPVQDYDLVNKKYSDALVSGATGSFTAASGEVVTVANGLITFITSTFLILLETGDSILMENSDRVENG